MSWQKKSSPDIHADSEIAVMKLVMGAFCIVMSLLYALRRQDYVTANIFVAAACVIAASF